jgi:anti-sigma-K factor RskA
LAADPELQAYVARLTAATGALAGAVPAVEPPPQLRAKVLAQVAPQQKMVTLPERKSGFALWLPWSLATCLAILCLLLSAQDSRLKNSLASQSQQINGLSQLAQSLQSATNDLQQTVTSQGLQIGDLNRLAQTLESATNDLQHTVFAQGEQISDLNRLAEALQSATNDLQKTVFALQETNRLASLRIAMLNSLLSDEPKAVAVSLWDNSKQEGVFVVQNLKPLPVDRDYQLWVLDNGTTPVDAGVFRVDDNGGVRVDFKAKLPIKVPGRFAVTEEVRGGVASPTIKNMVLASN